MYVYFYADIKKILDSFYLQKISDLFELLSDFLFSVKEAAGSVAEVRSDFHLFVRFTENLKKKLPS